MARLLVFFFVDPSAVLAVFFELARLGWMGPRV